MRELVLAQTVMIWKSWMNKYFLKGEVKPVRSPLPASKLQQGSSVIIDFKGVNAK